MQQDGPAVALLIHKVDGGTGHLAAAGQRRFVGAQTVHARPAEGRDERRVDVQDAARVGRNDAGPQHGEEPGQHHKVDVVGFQLVQQSGVEIFAAFVVPAADHHAFHPGLGGPLQRIDAGLGGHHQRDPAVGVLPAGLAVQQGL